MAGPVGMLAGLALAAAPLLSQAAGTNDLTNTITPSPEIGESLLRVFGALVVVIALFLGAAWLFRNWQQLPIGQKRKSRIQIVEAKSVGNRQTIFIVNCQGHQLLLGSSPAGIQMLRELDPELPEEAGKPFQAILDEESKDKS